MKNNLPILFLLFLTGSTLFITTCTKDEVSEEQRKEAITLNLNYEINADTLKSIVTWMQDIGTRFALSGNHRDVALKIRNRFKMIGYSDARIDSFMIIQSSKKIKLMLNNDMIAYQPGFDQLDWVVNIIDYDNSHNLRTKTEQMCTRFTVLKYKNDNTYNKQSDSYPFFTNGYKALFFFSNYVDPNYHSLNDLVGNCNFEYCREIVKVCCALLVDNN